MVKIEERHHKAAAKAIGPEPGATWGDDPRDIIAQALALHEERIAAWLTTEANAHNGYDFVLDWGTNDKNDGTGRSDYPCPHSVLRGVAEEIRSGEWEKQR